MNPSFSSESVSHLAEETLFCSSYCLQYVCSLSAKILIRPCLFSSCEPQSRFLSG